MTHLLDANVLIALTINDHTHNRAAHAWFATSDRSWATCPITQGALLRNLLRDGHTTAQATNVLAAITEDPRHQFWGDDLHYNEVAMDGVIGHRQVTDAYLAALARKRAARLATFDQGLAALHTDVADLINTLQ